MRPARACTPWFVSPPGDPPWPTVVLAHGWAAVKEMNLDYFAAAFRDAGIAALVFDHRGFGASEGPRGDIDPARQIADYGVALDAAERMDGVDAGRLGVWGTSYSGGHVLCVAKDDRRVRAAVAQVPTISGGEATRRRGRTPPATEYVPAADTGGRDLDGDGGEPVDPAELPPAPDGEYPDADRWRFYAELPPERRRTWRNRITARSLERYAAYEPGACMPDVAVPLLVDPGRGRHDHALRPHPRCRPRGGRARRDARGARRPLRRLHGPPGADGARRGRVHGRAPAVTVDRTDAARCGERRRCTP